MRIFVTGATGTLGRPTVKKLVAAGHEVRALARSAANEPLLRQLGATPVRADLFDATSVGSAVDGCQAALHLATKIPPTSDARRRRSWVENDRIRIDGTRALVDAALATGVERLVYPSVCFTYPDRGRDWIDTDTEIAPAGMLESTVTAEREVERFSDAGRRGIVLRMGYFYGPTAPNTLDALALARRGMAPLLGRHDAYFPQIWVDDAAAAVVAALDRAPAGVYNVVDDEPLVRADVTTAIAFAVGRRTLMIPPRLVVRLVFGRRSEPLMRSQRVSNRRFKEVTGWQPTVASAREGWGRIAAEHRR